MSVKAALREVVMMYRLHARDFVHRLSADDHLILHPHCMCHTLTRAFVHNFCSLHIYSVCIHKCDASGNLARQSLRNLDKKVNQRTSNVISPKRLPISTFSWFHLLIQPTIRAECARDEHRCVLLVSVFMCAKPHITVTTCNPTLTT